MLRRKGFTLIELLVVIAIIGILAAMLFPVFARARESARKTQCLANVKNIAIAMNMYLVDYDRLLPREARSDVNDFYGDGGDAPGGGGCDNAATCANPYLKYPVVLDDYVKNRQVWRCPSARLEYTPPILWHPGRDWFAVATQVYNDTGEDNYLQCNRPYPPGWGGSVTDSYAQGWATSDPSTGGIALSIYGVEANYGLSASGANDAARWLIVAEVGAGLDSWSTFNLAFPDWCHVGCATTNPTPLQSDGDCLGAMADWTNCTWSQDCGMGNPKFGTDSSLRKTFTRHLGGSNIGFLDGHAKWFPADTILKGGPDWRPNKPSVPTTDLLFEGPVGLCYMPDL